MDKKKVTEVMAKLGNQVSPVDEIKEPEPVMEPDAKKRGHWVPSERRRQVSDLWYKGYLSQDISKAMGLTLKQVSDDLKTVRKLLEPSTVRAVEYYRNRSRRRLDIIRKAAWEIADSLEAKSGARVAALRLVKEVEELSTRVDGIVAEKMVAGPDQKAKELMKELRMLAEGKDGNGHKEIEVSEVVTTV